MTHLRHRTSFRQARRIVKEGKPTINASIVRREWKLPGLTTAHPVRATLKVLDEADWIRPAPARKGERPGRQRADFEVNPAVFGGRT